MVNQTERGLFATRIATGFCALALLVWTFHGVDFAKVSACLGGIGGLGFALIAAPAWLGLCVECWGFRWVFQRLGQPIRLRAILRVRLMTEAVAQTLPLGVVWAESLKPSLFGRHAAVPTARTVAALIARKYLLVGSQAVYVALLSACGFTTLRRLAQAFTGHASCAWSAFAVSVTLCLLAVGIRGASARGRLGDRVLSTLRRVPNARLRQALQRRQASFASTDRLSERYFNGGLVNTTLWPGVFFLGGWLCEALESFLILRLLGVEIDFFAVASAEVMLSFLKNVLFVLPAGIGVQDLGYVSCLSALGVPDALTLGAAFSALKRGKELFWAALGYALLATEASPAAAAEQLRVDPA